MGKFLDTVGNDDTSDCIHCPAGTFSNTEGASSWETCKACSPGLYSSDVGASACESCPAGTSTTVVADQIGRRRRRAVF
jgi:hypothetical protein